ncbi:hypothetical protein C1645_837892 [Glomus cerebriforme]|uniref:Uncharacterized protein n=1 Tax=Glomus cerebriforme TaxID=658196 RepID=A0A397SEQ4_9GLOM|nr:hypothetical protein C1645_837892 [Glomus cerebriforme]
MNIIITFLVFFYETSKSNERSEFNEWFKKHLTLIAIITVFSIGDVKLFRLFDSNFGGFDICSIKFSQLVLDLIIYGGFGNILLKDLPQLIIQILYATKFTTSYKIIAFFALIINIIVLVVSIVEYGYYINDIIKKRCGKRVKSDNDVPRDTVDTVVEI